jgi:hypothetical protein
MQPPESSGPPPLPGSNNPYGVGGARGASAPPTQPVQVVMMQAETDTNATLALVLGILSLIACAPLGPVGWWCAARSETPGGVRTAGLICSIIGTALFAIGLVFVLLWLVLGVVAWSVP